MTDTEVLIRRRVLMGIPPSVLWDCPTCGPTPLAGLSTALLWRYDVFLVDRTAVT
jgi:hypothetical protein